MQVNRTRQQSLAIRWILVAIREKKGRPTAPEAGRRADGRLQPRRRRHDQRENVHRMADANKAFAHFAW